MPETRFDVSDRTANLVLLDLGQEGLIASVRESNAGAYPLAESTEVAA